MSNDLGSGVDVIPDPEKQKWIEKLKVVLGVLDDQVGKLKPMDSKVAHPSQREREDLELSRANTEKRSEELKKKWREAQLDEVELQRQQAENFKVKQESIRNGESKLTVGKNLKSGSYGAVSLLESDTGVPLVIKTPTSPKYREELETEAEVYAKIGGHENIVTCYGMLETESGTRGLVLERIQGCVEIMDTFGQLNSKYEKGKLSYDKYIGTIQSIMRQMLSGLAKMEECGLSHNDIKDDNVMLDAKTGTVKLIDIGLATEHGEDSKQGHPMYQAPENIKGEKSTAKHDSYSAGAILQKFVEGAIRIMSPKTTELPIDVAQGEFGGRGKHAASRETEYVKFLNALSNPDPEKRMTPSEALNHPFLAESLLSDEEAKKNLASMYEPQVDRRAIVFDTVDELSSEGWIATYEHAVRANAVPESVSLSVSIEKALVLFEEIVEPSLERARALKPVIEGFKRLLANGAYADHPIMNAYLTSRVDEARREVESCHEKAGVSPADLEFPIGDREFSAAGWGTAYSAAVEAGVVEPEPQLAGAIRDSFGGLRAALETFESRPNWQETYDAAKFGENCLSNLRQQISALRKTPGFDVNHLMVELLKDYENQAKLQVTTFRSFVAEPPPFQIVAGFTAEAFLKTCRNAVDALAAPNLSREYEAVADALTQFEQCAAAIKKQDDTMGNRAQIAQDAVKALNLASGKFRSLSSSLRNKSVGSLTAYFDSLRKEIGARQREYKALAEWCGSLADVEGLEGDEQAQASFMLAAEAYLGITDEFVKFDKAGNWDEKVLVAASLVESLEKTQQEFERLRLNYPGVLEEQSKSIADKLKITREFPEFGLPFTAVLKFNAKAWQETYDSATVNVALPTTDHAKTLADKLREVAQTSEVYRNESNDWNERQVAGEAAIEALQEAALAVGEMQAIEIYVNNAIMGGYLGWMSGAISEELKLLSASYKMFAAVGASVEVTENFRNHWREAKSAAEEIFKRVAPTFETPPRRVKFSKFLPLKSGLGSALKDFENAVETNQKRPSDKNAEKVRKHLAEVEKFVKRHCSRLLLEPKKIQPNILEPQDQYWLPLLKALNEIVKGAQNLAAG